MQVYNGTAWTNVTGGAGSSALAVLRTLSFEFGGNGGYLPQSFYETTWSAGGTENSIRMYGGRTVHTGTCSWVVSFSSGRPTIQLSNSANFNAKSIWVRNYGVGSISTITIKGYNSSNALVGTVTADITFIYQQVDINLDAVRYLVISTNGTDPNGFQERLYFDDLSFEQ